MPDPMTMAEAVAAEVKSEVRSLNARLKWYDEQIRAAEMMSSERARWELSKAGDAFVLSHLLEITARAHRAVRGARWGMPLTPLDDAG